MSNQLDWTKYGKSEKKQRRVAVPVSTEMDKLITMFKQAYPDRKFSDTKVIGTFVEAGARLWVAQNFARKASRSEETAEQEE